MPGAPAGDQIQSQGREVACLGNAEETSESESSGSSSPDPAEAVVAPANANEAQEEPARGRSPRIVVRRYQGSRNRAGMSQELK